MKKMHGISTKAFAALLAVTLLVGSAIGGTLAWLTSKSDSLVNTFTIGNVKIELTEKAGGKDHKFKVTPGVPVAKDPKVSVDKESEDCWVFVEVEKQGIQWVNGDLSYTIREGWSELLPGVYYREVKNADPTKEFYVLAGPTNEDTNLTEEQEKELANGMVRVDEDITSLDANTKLTFTAYAIQQEGFNDSEKSDSENAAAAWKAIEEQSK